MINKKNSQGPSWSEGGGVIVTDKDNGPESFKWKKHDEEEKLTHIRYALKKTCKTTIRRPI